MIGDWFLWVVFGVLALGFTIELVRGPRALPALSPAGHILLLAMQGILVGGMLLTML